MGMTRLSAMIIANKNNDIRCQAGGPSKENNKWAGWIILYKYGEYHIDLVSTDAIFDSEDTAIKAMEDVVTEIRKTINVEEEFNEIFDKADIK